MSLRIRNTFTIGLLFNVKRQSNHGSRILLAPELGGMKLGKCEGDVLLKFERHFPIVIFDGELIFDVIFTIRVNVHG